MDLRGDLAAYLAVDDDGPLLKAAVAALEPDGQRTIDFLVGLNAQIQQKVAYVVRLEAGVQTPDETLALGSGSCRDSAWLQVQMLRKRGLAARFVSGYLIQLKADIDPIDGAQGTQTDFADLHAWAEVYLPGAGWIGFDATSGLLCGEGHLPLAASPHYRSSAPSLRHGGEPAQTTFEFEMKVSRLVDEIRITRPFEDKDWAALDRLGRRIETRLQKEDVRLTMGGEPTFVSIDDFEAPEWNTDASGPTKPAIAVQLIERLKARFGVGGLLHYGQGKWYPGEPLPRWALGLFWRRDSQPVWRGTAAAGSKRVASIAEAHALIQRLAGRLGVDPAHAMAAREDPLVAIKAEGDLPADVKLDDEAIDDEGTRDRPRRAMAGGLSKAVGYVLPLRRPLSRSEGKGWLSEAWRFRRKHLYLVGGDSPVGLRLQLGGLPTVKPKDYPYVTPVDPYEDRGAAAALRRRSCVARAGYGRQASGPPSCVRRSRSSPGTDTSMSSCRRSRGWRTISTCSRRSRSRRRRRRYASRGIRRLTTCGWAC